MALVWLSGHRPVWVVIVLAAVWIVRGLVGKIMPSDSRDRLAVWREWFADRRDSRDRRERREMRELDRQRAAAVPATQIVVLPAFPKQGGAVSNDTPAVTGAPSTDDEAGSS